MARPLIRFAVTKEPLRWWQAIFLASTTTSLALLLRGSLAQALADQSPYVAFLAAVVVSSLWGGFLGGVAAVLISGVLANIALVGPIGSLSDPDHRLAALLFFVAVASFLASVGAAFGNLLRREHQSNQRMEIVGRELEHRAKNLLTVVQSLLHQAARTSGSASELEAKVAERLGALAIAQSLLAESAGGPVGLERLLEEALRPFASEQRILLQPDNPAVRVPPDLAIALSMLLYELATNSVKHGALSSDRGRVTLGWRMERAMAALRWEEEGGPPVSAPRRTGMGTRLIENAIPRGRGAVKLDYRPDGLSCLVSFRT